MRAPNALLLAAQKTGQVTPLVRLALTGASPVTYSAGRLLRGEYTEQVFNHKLLITLDNRDDALDSLNFKGYQADLSFGATVSGSPYYSQVAPLWVLNHRFDSAPKVKELHLTCVGLPNLLMEDRASANYEPDSDNNDTLETIFKAVANASLACFNHCDNITVTVDSRDALINAYIPKDSLRIYKGTSRLAILRMLIDYTKCIMRFEADGAIHIRVPVVSGESYDDIYDFDTGGRHPFFSRAYSEALVIPNRFVVSSLEGDDPQFSGLATHAASYALLAKSQFESTTLASNAQGIAIAEALIAKAAIAADGGSIYCKIMNTAQELYDYVLCEDSRQGDSRAGSIGALIRRFDVNTGQFDMTLTYGAWLSIRQEMNNLEAYPAGFGSTGTFFSRLTVKDLYAERILADSLDMVWVDPDGNVDLSLIGDNLDSLPDGSTYARVKSLHMDAGQIVLNEAVSYSAGFDPRDKFDLEDNDFDDIPEGSTYNRVLSTQINAGKILLSDELEYSVGYNPVDKTRTFIAEPTTPYALGDLWLDASVVKRCTIAREVGAYQAGDWTATTLDEIANGSSFKRVATAALSAGGLVLLDQVTVGTYGLVLAADISAGHILLSSVVQTSSYRTSTDAEKGIWSGKTVTFAQDGIPTSLAAGDVWMDTNDGNKLYRATAAGDNEIGGGEWIEMPPSMDNVAAGGTYGKVLNTSITAGKIILSQVTADGSTEIFTTTEQSKLGAIEALADVTGTSQAATVAALSGLDLDDLADGSTYGRVVLTDISSGHILLASVTEDETHKVYSGAEKTKLGTVDTNADVTGSNQSATTASLSGLDMDDLADGTTYKRIRATSLSSGNLYLTSNVVVSGEWYSESGVEIDATHGINIYGAENALTTRAGKTDTVQCYVGANGNIYAGAGDVSIGAHGIRIYSQYALSFYFEEGLMGSLWANDASNVYLYSAGNLNLSKTADLVMYGGGSFRPSATRGGDLGSSSKWWKNIYGTVILRTSAMAPVVNGALIYTDGTADLLVYDSAGAGAWRTNSA